MQTSNTSVQTLSSIRKKQSIAKAERDGRSDKAQEGWKADTQQEGRREHRATVNAADREAAVADPSQGCPWKAWGVCRAAGWVCELRRRVERRGKDGVRQGGDCRSDLGRLSAWLIHTNEKQEWAAKITNIHCTE